MSGLVAIEGELNSAIQEYLEYIGFDGTLEKFNEECFAKGKSVANVERRQKNIQKTNQILNEMVQLFCHGERKEFFRRWLQNIPSTLIQNNIDAQKLEFELNIYFAIYPLRKGGKEARTQYEDSISSFKTFIETRGRVLSQKTEYLPFFALPYVPQPEENPGYQQVFSEDWSIQLQRKLEEFLSESLKGHQHPRLVDAYNSQSSKVSVTNMQQQLSESEKRTIGYMKKFNKVQADYHNLIGITAELVDSLENTIRGHPVTSEYLQNICNRLFSSQFKQSIDFTRPGTAGEYIRQSLAYQKSNLEKDKVRISSPLLDFTKLKHDLMNCDTRLKALILQALRWRLTKSPPGEQREKILDSYITNDLLTIKSNDDKNSIIFLLNSEDEVVKQYMARILNAFASLNKGRSYLASNSKLIKIMEDALRSEQEDTLCRQNLLAALQKTQRNLQTLMINDNIILWLLSLLEDTEILSDYTLEYAVALLMNLCLRSSGKIKCTQDYKKTIKVLSDLLGNSNHEIRPYVNGALYSVLSVPSIRAYAKKIDLEDTLKTYLNDGNAEINTQIQFIINQINSNETSSLNESDSENEDNDDDDEEDQDAMETDLDKTELIKANQNELIGETLLNENYTYSQGKNNKHRIGVDITSESIVLNRPTTPHQLRQSFQPINLLQNANHVDSTMLDRPNSEQYVIGTNVIKNKNIKSQFNESFETKLDPQNKTKHGSILNQSLTINSTKNGPQNIEKLTKLTMKSATENKKNSVTGKVNSERNSPSEKNVNKLELHTDSDKNHQKLQNSVESINTTNVNYNKISTSNSFVPKFSTFEPRPSSANSAKSNRNSSDHSAIANLSEHLPKRDNQKS